RRLIVKSAQDTGKKVIIILPQDRFSTSIANHNGSYHQAKTKVKLRKIKTIRVTTISPRCELDFVKLCDKNGKSYE
ncbi:MAG TPA: hypothetical protein VLN09_09805, partial [Psychrobacter sp.]|uniref:hypothetical protein n=1 Tax=Psychrobacter sp. TaxID=56811 RepID=UPI002BC71EAC